ncbi:hypothetical protein F5Y04DRAFT_287059 [Hypomontagnella monticulosa]|nr:hypothetical protein F5Y04DRAFT_287059 [Hypomontagnella monticulosa]
MTTTATRANPSPPGGRPSADSNHLIMPKYAPFGTYQNPKLEKVGHKARDLLNFTVMAFHTRRDCDLNDRQLAARKDFTARFRDRKRFYGGDFDVNSLEELRHDIQCLADSLDAFFFFKLLRHAIKLGSGINVVGEDPLGLDEKIEGETFVCKVRDREYIQININIGSDETGLYELSAIAGQLVHEMVHAYFLHFACDCAKCDKDRLNTVGVEHDGHGPLFLMLHRLIVTEIRRWGESAGDKELRMLSAADCPGESVSKSAIVRAQAAIERMSSREKKSFNKIRSTENKTFLISLHNESKKVLVNPNLMKRHLSMEDVLRGKERREKRFIKDLMQRRGEKGGPNDDGEYDDTDEDSEDSDGLNTNGSDEK